MNEFDSQLRQILESVIGLRDNTYGYPKSELDEAEQRLGVQLPHALRSMYQHVGKHVLWRDAHHPLVVPLELTIEDEHLVFLDEQQNVVEYVLRSEDLGLDDPPVFQRQPEDSDELYPEPSNLSQFLLESLCWQLLSIGEDLEENAEGLESYHGKLMSHAQAQQHVADMKRVALNNGNHQRSETAYFGERAVAFLFVGEEMTSVYSWNASFDDDEAS